MSRALEGTNRVFTEAGEDSLGDLVAATARVIGDLAQNDAPVALVCSDGLPAVAAAAALAVTRQDGLILPRSRAGDPMRSVLADAGYRLIDLEARTVLPPSRVTPAQPGRICLLTSGTSGAPKIVPHTWESLFTLPEARELRPQRWLVTYQSGTYAWFQMVTLAAFVRGQDLVVPAGWDPHSLAELALRRHATAVSSTPTFWRFLLLQLPEAKLRSLEFRQITLGGERVDQALLDQIRAVQPAARLTHIYASAEVGAAIVVHDGREGFPRAWLEDERDIEETSAGPMTASEITASETTPAKTATAAGDASARPRLSVRGDALWVWSPFSAADHQGWTDTGDVVEVRGDRVIVTGRRDQSVVNVGGAKVSVFAIERALLDHPQVLFCRVKGIRAPLMGQILAADIVPRRPVADLPALERELTRYLSDRFPEVAVPRLWNLLETIPSTDSHKAATA